YLLYWTAAWILYAFHLLPNAMESWRATDATLFALSQGLYALAGFGFFLGTQSYTHKKLHLLPSVGAALVLAAWSVANAYQLVPISAVVPGSLGYVAVGYLFWRESYRNESVADQLLGLAFALWGGVAL